MWHPRYEEASRTVHAFLQAAVNSWLSFKTVRMEIPVVTGHTVTMNLTLFASVFCFGDDASLTHHFATPTELTVAILLGLNSARSVSSVATQLFAAANARRLGVAQAASSTGRSQLPVPSTVVGRDLRVDEALRVQRRQWSCLRFRTVPRIDCRRRGQD